MKELKLTQQQVADATGFQQAYVSKVCNGTNDDIMLENARRFAKFFGCTIEDLFPARERMAVAS